MGGAFPFFESHCIVSFLPCEIAVGLGFIDRNVAQFVSCQAIFGMAPLLSTVLSDVYFRSASPQISESFPSKHPISHSKLICNMQLPCCVSLSMSLLRKSTTLSKDRVKAEPLASMSTSSYIS